MTDVAVLRQLLGACDRYAAVQGELVDELAAGRAGAAVAVALRAHLDQLGAAVREADLVLAEHDPGTAGP